MAVSTLAADLSRCWRELGTILASRRLLASLSGGAVGGLTPTKLRALELLGESGGLQIRDLAARMAVDETTATRLADRLEAIGAATRERRGEDRRATTVVLTSVGERLAPDAARRHREFGGHDVVREGLAIRRILGYIPQAISIDSALTARENLEFYARVTDVPRKERRERIAHAVSVMGLETFLDRLGRNLSGGMLRRLEI